MATVYIHIGAPKTATSTLQAVLAGKYNKLLSQGILYPRNCRHGDAHHVLVCDLIEKYHGQAMPDLWYGNFPRGEAWSALRGEIKEHGDAVGTVILSSELFFGQANKIDLMLQDVRENLAGHDVKIVVYLRRQDQLYSSFYNQDVKGARQWSGSAYEFYETHQIFQRDYYDMLQSWGEVFDPANLLVRAYEPAQWLDGSIIRDFCDATGMDMLPAPFRDSNEGLGVTQLYVKRCLNRVGYSKADNAAVLKLLVQLLPEASSKDVLYVNRKLYNKYRRDWSKTNKRLARHFLHREELFNEALPVAEALQEYRVDQEKIAAFMPALFRYFSQGKAQLYRSLFARTALFIMAEQNAWAVLADGERSALLSWVD